MRCFWGSLNYRKSCYQSEKVYRIPDWSDAELQGLVLALELGTGRGPGQSEAEEEVGWQAEAAREEEQPSDSARLVIDSLRSLSRVF